MTDVFDSRWTKKQITLLPPVDGYTRIMRFLIGRVQPRHQIDEDLARQTLSSLADGMYRQAYADLRLRRPGVDAPQEKKVQYNLSVTQLRKNMKKAKLDIFAKFRAW